VGKALERALALLARRAYAEAELRRRLGDFPEEEVDAALARLKAWGYLDDRAYAEAFVRARRGRWGPYKLRRALLDRGVPLSVVEKVVAGEDGLEQAVSLLARRWHRYRNTKARAVRFLVGRGFSLEVALRAYERLRSAPPEG